MSANIMLDTTYRITAQLALAEETELHNALSQWLYQKTCHLTIRKPRWMPQRLYRWLWRQCLIEERIVR